MSGKLIIYTPPTSTNPESNYGLQFWFVQNCKLKLNVLLVTYQNGGSPFSLPPKIPQIPSMSFEKSDLVEAFGKEKKRKEALHSIKRNCSSSCNISFRFQVVPNEQSCLVSQQNYFWLLYFNCSRGDEGETARTSFMKTVRP